jgi:hypothetical protein
VLRFTWDARAGFAEKLPEIQTKAAGMTWVSSFSVGVINKATRL